MQFVLEDDVLGSLDLSCENGYCISDYDLGWPEVRESVQNRTLSDGTIDWTEFHGNRTVTLTIGINGNVDVPSVLTSRLAGFVHPKRRPTLVFADAGGGPVRQMNLRGHAASLTVDDPKFRDLSVSWKCPDGIIEDTELSTMTLRPGSTGEELGRVYPLNFPRVYPSSPTAGGGTLLNTGTAPAHWKATIYGACSQPVLSLGPYSIRLLVTLLAGQFLTIESRGRRILMNGTTATPGGQYLDWANSDWWVIPPNPANADARFDALTYDARASAVIEWRSTWVL